MIWVDAHLSPALAKWITAEFAEAAQSVRDVGLRQAKDKDIFASARQADAITLKITGTNYEVTVAGEKEPDRGTSTFDQSTNPKRLAITSTNGPNRGKTFLAIYEMKDGNSLRVCYDLSGAEFPKEFKAPKGTQCHLVGYRRPQDTAPAVPEHR